MAKVVKGFALLFQIILCYLEVIYRFFIPKPNKNIQGKIVLITGGGNGLGRELALQFSGFGAKVVLWDISKDGNDATAAEINKRGGEAHAYLCDVTKIDDVKRVAERVRRDVGDVDLLVNNAGILHGIDLMTLEESQIRRTMEVNTMAHFWTIREFLPKMMEANEGHIVTIASMAGIFGSEFLVDYSASKFAVVGLTQALRNEMDRMGKDGVITTTVCPMFINTNLIKGKDFSSGQLGVLEPEDVAKLVVDGVLKNEKFVFAPPKMRYSAKIASLLPEKAAVLLGKSAENHFNFPSKKTD